MTKTIELDLDDLTVIDEWMREDPTRERPTPFCSCGKAIEIDGPDRLAGAPIVDWPCVKSRRWSYCATIGRIIYDVR